MFENKKKSDSYNNIKNDAYKNFNVSVNWFLCLFLEAKRIWIWNSNCEPNKIETIQIDLFVIFVFIDYNWWPCHVVYILIPTNEYSNSSKEKTGFQIIIIRKSSSSYCNVRRLRRRRRLLHQVESTLGEICLFISVCILDTYINDGRNFFSCV